MLWRILPQASWIHQKRKKKKICQLLVTYTCETIVCAHDTVIQRCIASKINHVQVLMSGHTRKRLQLKPTSQCNAQQSALLALIMHGIRS